MKTDNYVRQVAEDFRFDVNDGWGNENSMILQGFGMLGKMRENEYIRHVASKLIQQIPYDKKYAAIASFYELENGELDVKDRISDLMKELNQTFDQVDDEMALVFYTKYETKLGGKEHYQDVMNRYKAAAAKSEKNNAYFLVSVIEGIESIDQAVYEYYDGLKTIFKTVLKDVLVDEELDETDKALAAYAVLKACRLKVILSEKYEEIGLRMYEEAIANAESKEINQGAVVMLLAEKSLH